MAGIAQLLAGGLTYLSGQQASQQLESKTPTMPNLSRSIPGYDPQQFEGVKGNQVLTPTDPRLRDLMSPGMRSQTPAFWNPAQMQTQAMTDMANLAEEQNTAVDSSLQMLQEAVARNQMLGGTRDANLANMEAARSRGIATYEQERANVSDLSKQLRLQQGQNTTNVQQTIRDITKMRDEVLGATGAAIGRMSSELASMMDGAIRGIDQSVQNKKHQTALEMQSQGFSQDEIDLALLSVDRFTAGNLFSQFGSFAVQANNNLVSNIQNALDTANSITQATISARAQLAEAGANEGLQAAQVQASLAQTSALLAEAQSNFDMGAVQAMTEYSTLSLLEERAGWRDLATIRAGLTHAVPMIANTAFGIQSAYSNLSLGALTGTAQLELQNYGNVVSPILTELSANLQASSALSTWASNKMAYDAAVESSRNTTSSGLTTMFGQLGGSLIGAGGELAGS